MLNDCVVCGGKAEGDWGGVAEFNGKAEQDFTIECENDSDSNHHGLYLLVTIDNNGDFKGNSVEQVLMETWNKLNPQK